MSEKLIANLVTQGMIARSNVDRDRQAIASGARRTKEIADRILAELEKGYNPTSTVWLEQAGKEVNKAQQEFEAGYHRWMELRWFAETLPASEDAAIEAHRAAVFAPFSWEKTEAKVA